MREGDVVIGRGTHDWRLGICTEVDVNSEGQARVVYEWGPLTYDALHSRRATDSRNRPRVQVLGHLQRTIVSAAIAAEALRRIT